MLLYLTGNFQLLFAGFEIARGWVQMVSPKGSLDQLRPRLETRTPATTKRPLVSGDDFFFLAQAPLLFLTALLVNERRWPRAAQSILKLADLLRPQSVPENLAEGAAAAGLTPATLEAMMQASRVSRVEHLIHGMKVLLAPRWRPRIEIVGRNHLDAALEEGNGAVIWVSHFCFSSLFTKMGMSDAGYQVGHISRPEHGISKSWLGVRLLNKVRSAAEDRFLAKRIVHDRNNPADTKRVALEHLDNNGIVSVTVGAWEGRKVAIAPVLNGPFQVAAGAPGLAFSASAPLFGVFTTRTPDGGYRIEIGPALAQNQRTSRDSFLLEASVGLLKQHEAVITASPAQWRGWKDWLKLRSISSD